MNPANAKVLWALGTFDLGLFVAAEILVFLMGHKERGLAVAVALGVVGAASYVVLGIVCSQNHASVMVLTIVMTVLVLLAAAIVGILVFGERLDGWKLLGIVSAVVSAVSFGCSH